MDLGKFVFLLVFMIWPNCEAKNYEGCKLYDISVKATNSLDFITELEEKLNLDFWDSNTVMVAPENENEFLFNMKQRNFEISLVNDNLEKSVQSEKIENMLTNAPKEGQIDFKNYHRYDTINSFLKRIVKEYPKIASLETIGKSYEGREIFAIKISSGGSDIKPVIFIDAGIHAREWISPATALYLIQQMVEDTKNANLYQKFDWYIIPLINPDGYEYTHTTDRFWRKTRSKNKVCYGTDANRNYGFKWGLTGSSTDECSLTYRGEKAFSESETRAVRDLALKHRKNIKLYLTLHRYGQYLLHAWGYTEDVVQGVEDIVRVANSANDAIKAVNGTTYRIGSSAGLLGLMSGSSRDYFAGEVNVKYSYTVELPGGGTQGFDLPPQRIEGVVKETFEGIKAFWKEISNIYT